MKNNTFQGFRIIFAIGIVLSHCSFLPYIGQYLSPLSNVCFFFMLSGFLLKLTFREQSFWTFMKKKLFRIWPLHLFMLGAMIVVKLINGTVEVSAANFLTLFAHILLIQTWIPSVEVATAYYTISWFLSSLMFCFIIGYFLTKYLNKGKQLAKIVLYILTGLFLTVKIIVSIILPYDNEWGYYLVYLCPLACLPDFLIGFLLYDIFKKINVQDRIRVVFQIIALCLIVFMFFLKHWLPDNYNRGFYTIPFNALLIFAFSKESKWSSVVFGNKPLVFLGAISFEIYLIHDLVITGLKKYTPIIDWLSDNIHPTMSAVTIVMISIVLAIAYHYAFGYLVGLLRKEQNQ